MTQIIDAKIKHKQPTNEPSENDQAKYIWFIYIRLSKIYLVKRYI